MRRALIPLAGLAVTLSTLCADAGAAPRFAVANGAWNQTAPTTIWSAVSGGAPGASVPGAGDTVTIGETATPRAVTIPAGYAARATSVTIGSGSQPGVSSLALAAATAALNVSGAVSVNAPSNNNATNLLGADAGSVTIGGGLTLTGGVGNRRAELSISTGTLTTGGALGVNNATALVTFSGAGTLNIGGNFTSGATFTPSTGTVVYNGAGAQSIGAYGYNNLTINKSGGAAALTGNTTVAGNLGASAGTFNVPGFNLTVTGATSVSGTLGFITSTAGTKIFNGPVTIDPSGTWSNVINGAVTLNGNVTNNGTFASGTGLYTFSGGAAQTFTGAVGGTTTFSGSVTINNANGLALLAPVGGTHDVTVTGTLTLTSGRVTTNSNVLHIASGNAIAGAGANTFVEGNLRKPFPVNLLATVRNFETGTTAGGNRYTPVDLTFNNVVTAGAITVRSTAGSHPQLASSGLDTATPHKLNRYWTVSNGGAVFTSYNAMFNFVAADIDAGANPLAFVATRYFPPAPAAGDWNPTTGGANTATQITLTGLTAFGDFAMGEPLGYNATLGRFNAYDPPPLTPVGSVHGNIRTKVAATPFSLTVVHLNATGTALQNMGAGGATVTVALIDGTTTTGAFTNNCWGSWLTAPAILSTTVAFTAAQTTGTALFLAVPNVYRDVRVRITGGGQTGCSSDRFAIRPSAISVSASDGDWTTAGTSRVLNVATAIGGVVHKAGQPFTLSAVAIPPTATSYSGSPIVRSLACLLPLGCSTGALTLGAWAGGGGSRSATATYSEAGTFNLQLEDQVFALVDTADSTTAQRYVPQTGGLPALVGRFVPNHFDVAVNNPAGTGPTFRTFGNTCATRSFTYIGQSFGFVPGQEPQALVSARNASGAITLNYSGTGVNGLWKILAANVSMSYANTPVTALATVLNAPLVIPGLGITGIGAVTINSADTLVVTRDNAAPVAPFNANIRLTVSVSDTSESLVPGNGTILTASAAFFDGGGSGIAFDGGGPSAGKELRYGRLRIQNAHGSELIGMPVPIQTQYWNGSAFVANTADYCTTFTAANVTLGNYRANLSAGETTVTIGGAFNAGIGVLRLSAPGPGNGGSVDLSVNLTGNPAGASCTAGMPASTPSGASYLQGSWCGATYGKDPTSRATFGVYRNSDQMIYQRENF